MADNSFSQKQLYDDLERVASDLPPNDQRALLTILSKWKRNETDRRFSMLLTGRTGSGKSTLCNGIIGDNVAKEGDSIKARCTTQVKKYQTKKNGVSITVWDSPGLQDGTEFQDDYLKQIKDNCSTVDMVLYCIKVSDTRFIPGDDNPDVSAMRKLTKGFGAAEFWRKTVIILTYANTLESFNIDWEDLNEADKAKAFNAKIQEWERQIKLILKEDVKIPNEIVEGIRVIPAGHAKKPHLLGIEYWLSNLWFQCLFSMSSPDTRCTLLQINLSRFKKADEVTKDSFQRPLEEQPIVVTESTLKRVAGGAGGGAVVGGVIGAVVGGPLGAAVGVGIGALLGGGAGKLWSLKIYSDRTQ